MDFKNIKVRSEQAIGFVQIDRVAEKNSLDIQTSKEILQALQNLDQDNSIKCIAIEGNQKLFSPGADIKELQNLTKNKAAEQNSLMPLMKFIILKNQLLHWLKVML